MRSIKKTRLDYLVWLIFIGLGLTGILNHEIWLDEAHHWLIVRHVKDVAEFVKVESIDGQPFMWPILLYIVHLLSDEILAFQLFHFAIGATSAFLIIRFSPFKRVDRYLVAFGYTMLYEYLVISRNYSLSVLLILFYLICFRRKNIVAKSIVLGIIANTHFFAAILASFIFLYEAKPSIKKLFVYKRNETWSYVIFALFIFVLFLQLWNSQNHAVIAQYNNWTFVERIKRVVLLNFRAFVMIPDFTTIHFWNGSLILKASKFFAVLVIPAFLFPMLVLKKASLRLSYYSTVIVISAVIFSIHQPVAARYASFIFISFLVFYWLSIVDFPDDLDKISSTGQRLLRAILMVHVLSGFLSIYYEYKLPFSQGKSVAEFINRGKYKDYPLVIHSYSPAPAVTVYLGKEYHSLVTQDKASFCHWGTNPFMVSEEVFVERLEDYVVQMQQSVLLVKSKVLPDNSTLKNEILQFEKISVFEPSVISNESYFIYEVSLK